MHEVNQKNQTIIVEEADDEPNQAWNRVLELITNRQLLSTDVTVSQAYGSGSQFKRYVVPMEAYGQTMNLFQAFLKIKKIKGR